MRKLSQQQCCVGQWSAVLRLWLLLAMGMAAFSHSKPANSQVPPAKKASPSVHRALTYLGREVPRWSRENHCFSCHNNGDAARALLEARRLSLSIPENTLTETLSFLSRPGEWNRNGVDAAFSDKRLARLQFTMALASAIKARALADRELAIVAAQQLVNDQAEDGAWPIDEAALVGSPATYGKPLATALAKQTLTQIDRKRFAQSIADAERWLRGREIPNVLDACATLVGLSPGVPANVKARSTALALLGKAQSEDGGWGPFVNSPSEVFDTALALLVLSQDTDRAKATTMIQRGRKYLVDHQSEDGSWPETTRPTGSESYAQRLSTTGWATLALLATESLSN